MNQRLEESSMSIQWMTDPDNQRDIMRDIMREHGRRLLREAF